MRVLPYAAAADVLAEAIAGTLTAGPGTDTDPAPQRWGEFLVAGLYVRHVLDLPPVQELARGARLGEAVPRDLRGVLDLDLARSAPGLDVQVLQAVARALAFAEGSGMPEQVAQHAAAAFLPSPEYPAGLGSGETRKALDRLRFYLRRDVDLDGSTLYRLFHQGLADQLRADAGEDATAVTGPGPAARVWQHLYAMIPAGPDGSRQWQHAEPYLLRHAAQHAAAAGRARRPAPGHRVPHPRRPGHPGPAARGPARRRRRRGSRHLPRLLRLSLPAAPGCPRADPGRRRGPLRKPRPGPAPILRSYLAARLGEQPEQVSQTAPDPDRPHRRGARGGGGPGRGPRRDRLRRRRRDGAGLGRGDRAAGRPAADRPHRLR